MFHGETEVTGKERGVVCTEGDLAQVGSPIATGSGKEGTVYTQGDHVQVGWAVYTRPCPGRAKLQGIHLI